MTWLPTALLLLAAPPAADAAFFEAKVRPVLFARCQECHSTRTKKKRGGLLLDGRAAILAGGDTGPAAVPGDPGKSLLIQAARYEHATVSMPPTGKMPAAEIAVLEEWVRGGLVYPGPAAAVADKEGIDLAAGKRFWSFVPAVTHEPPAVRAGAWPRDRIDRFLLAEMEKRGLGPSPEADRRTLIRRVTFDLVGLPPSPEEVEAFAADGRPDAYERLVDRLLASPRHGERWGRFWLDLVRYCDVAEEWVETKGARWLYRDWVVRALNADVPYDEFVRKQLAADLLPGAKPADRAALGFLGLNPTYWKELKLDPVVIKGVVAEEWEERVHTLGSTFLGLTVACARCHDHKFDPITAQDYYALAGVFASVREADLSLLPADAEKPVRAALARLKAIDDETAALGKMKGADAKIAALTAEAAKLRATPRFSEPMVPGVVEASLHVLADGPDRTRIEYRPAPQDVALQIRGNPGSPGPVVPRRFLSVLSDAPRPFGEGSGRLDLARAIVTDARSLAARVMVNRLWGHHFGAGLVRTPSDFGRQGDRPTHPELLDDLAARFAAGGWGMKGLHRELVLCAAYRQSSRTADPARVAADPDNRLLARMGRRRLEVEAWRDATLAVTAALDAAVGGPPLDLDRADNP
ncbi:MAG: PSD1 and planctomycete cytochrome C domain-containing protein, partial [Gemmataceae bacterium]